jgi:succinylglutamic semialdehyde dehydrogenase
MPIQLTGQQFIDGSWVAGKGQEWSSRSPFRGEIVWNGRWSDVDQVKQALVASRRAFADWSMLGLDARESIARNFAKVLQDSRGEFAELITRETGKPLWEADSEVATAIGKVQNSVDAIRARRWTTTEGTADQITVTRYRPLGVMTVLGPFNLPAHLPGAHFVPALLAGNTVVFKPSEKTPAVGEYLARAWQMAGLPDGVLNLVHGTGEIAQAAAMDEMCDGVLFTGSYRVGQAIHRGLAGRPEKMLALEMGGNNALVIDQTSNIDAAVYQIILSAYITSGQRCTCARRLIVVDSGNGQAVLDRLASVIPTIRVGDPLGQPQPFLGTLISEAAARDVLDGQQKFLEQGGRAIQLAKPLADHPAALTPGLLESQGNVVEDCELFGPLLIVQRAANLVEAVRLANQTRYGLSAGLISDQLESWEYFVSNINAGIVNWNRQTTGASGRLPFGGVGASGNHRPSGFFAADYCSFPVASMESGKVDLPQAVQVGLEDVVAQFNTHVTSNPSDRK